MLVAEAVNDRFLAVTVELCSNEELSVTVADRVAILLSLMVIEAVALCESEDDFISDRLLENDAETSIVGDEDRVELSEKLSDADVETVEDALVDLDSLNDDVTLGSLVGELE